MKKIYYADIPMTAQTNKYVYESRENSLFASEQAVTFIANILLYKTIQKGDDVKIVLLKKKDIENNADRNEQAFKEEFQRLCGNIGANVEFVTLESPFVESRKEHEKLLRHMVGELEEGCELYADITFGAKPLPLLIFNTMNFAEKCFHATVKYILYGKVDFVSTPYGIVPVNPVLFDVTPLYYLNNVTNSIQSENGAEALDILDVILKE